MEKSNYVTEEYTNKMANIREKIRTFEKQGKNVVYTAVFITGKDKVKLVDRAPATQLALVGRNLKYENPDKVRIELYDGEQSKNMLWVAEIMINRQVDEDKHSASGFQGLGEAEINQIVDERFRQRQQNLEYEQLKEQVAELSDENQSLQDELDTLRNEKEGLEKEIESKKNIRYYAGMLGDILESFGIAKEKIRTPLAGLMGISEVEKQKEEPVGFIDNSGLVKDVSPEEEKRKEIINLISEYLRSSSNQTLANVFSIFSEIEKDESVADKVLQYINTLKQ
jgi:FtsZ-binding cell division protein ZapB